MRILWLAVGAFLILLAAGYALLGTLSPGWVAACRDSQASGIVDALWSEGVGLIWDGANSVEPRLDLRCQVTTRLIVPLPEGLNRTIWVGG